MGFFSGQYRISYHGNFGYDYAPDVPPLQYRDAKGASHRAPEKMVSYFEHSPRVLWMLPGYNADDYERPAIIHDYIYQQHAAGNPTISFGQANTLLEEMCRAEHCPRYRAWGFRVACNLGARCLWEGKDEPPEFTLLDSMVLQTAIDMMEESKWKILDGYIKRMDFASMDEAAIETWFAVTFHPEVSRRLPALAEARERCAKMLRAQDRKRADTFMLKFSRIGV